MDFLFVLPKDSYGNTGIVVFVDRLSKMAHLAAVPDTIDGECTVEKREGRMTEVWIARSALSAKINLIGGART